MRLSQYISPVQYKAVYANLCRLLRLLALTMAVPALVGVLAGDYYEALIFAVVGTAGFVVSLTGRSAGQWRMSGKEALVVVALSYLLYGAMGAFAFLPQTTYLNGFFEVMSGITTTGLSVISPESMSPSLLFFRSYSQWLGGAGIVILSLLILTGPSRNAFQLYATEFGEEKLVGNVRGTAVFVLKVYSLLTAAGYLVYLLVGFGPYDALLHILSTVSTGGFSSSSQSIGHFGGIALHGAVVVFMFLGAVGFPTYYLLRHRGRKSFFRDLQLRYLFAMLAIFSFIIWSAWQWRVDRILPSLFVGATSVTTTGYSTVPVTNWPAGVMLVSILLMLVGGSSGSTAGGFKLYRLILMLRTIRWYLLKALLPAESRIAIKVRDRAIDDATIRQTFGIAGLYALLTALSALCFVIYGRFPVIQSVFESVSAIGTVGLSSGVTSPALPAFLKAILIVDMWMGRLEILPVLVVLNPVIWIPRRS